MHELIPWIYQYKNIGVKLDTTKAAVWFNEMCRQFQMTPNSICIKVNGSNQQCHSTRKETTRFRINQKLKYLYAEKQNFNEQLYKMHLHSYNETNEVH
jgi:hypothetical protein